MGKISLFLINEIEGAAMTGACEAERILDVLATRYPNAGVVLTLGADGAWAMQDGTRHFQPCIPTKAVDTTAAGDTFSGYFLSAFWSGEPLSACLSLAARAAAIAVSRPGAAPSIPHRREL